MPAEQPSLGIWAESACTSQTWGEFPSLTPQLLAAEPFSNSHCEWSGFSPPYSARAYPLGSRLSLCLYPLLSLVFGCHRLAQPLNALLIYVFKSTSPFYGTLGGGQGKRERISHFLA